MTPLPIDPFLADIARRLQESRALVLVAEPGAGKTTRVPPAILRAGLLPREHPNLVMLQPRRVAARASAQRIAEENNWELGREVGYHVRFDRKIGPQTRLRVLTEGILTRQLLDDPFLEGVGGVLLDEFHERSLHTDVTIALLREVRQTVRDDLILLVMSATLDAEPVARFLGDCPIVRVPGRTFPVDVTYSLPSGERLPDRVAAAVEGHIRDTGVPPVQAMTGTQGAPFPTRNQHGRDARVTSQDDVLVFLPGAEEIRRTMERLGSLAQEQDLVLLPLYGSLPAEEQALALRPHRQRKVILATNIAETSLTIDGVGTVIDSGLARVAGYDPQRGLDRLDLKRISKASATQRAGRAGRTGPGRCVRLWTQREELAMADFELPEVRRVDLCGTVLALHAWGKPDPRAFGWYEPPPEETLGAAERLLAMLGALDSESGGSITPLGRAIMDLPVHPRLGRLLIGAAELGRLEEGAAVAALLSEKDIVSGSPFDLRHSGPVTQGPSDLTYRLELLAEAERARFSPTLRDRRIDPLAARQVAKVRDDLLRAARHLKRREVASGDRESDFLKLPLLAYPDRVCRRRASDPAAGAMVGGGGVRLAPDSVVRQGEFFLALDARHDERSAKREALVRVASRIEVEWLEALFPQSVRRERQAVYDPGRDRVVGRGATHYLDLPLREDADAPVDATTAGNVLAEWAKPRAVEILRDDDNARRWLARHDLLRKAMPEQHWPDLNDALGDLVVSAANRKRSLAELRPLLPGLLFGLLTHPLDRLFEKEAPETIEVPTGNRIRIDYPDQNNEREQVDRPVLAVRLQELFGWTDTPRIAGGRVPVKLHLLGPNYRPVQVTEDLRNFWATTYFQVRKDLRARYPKHAWPEDPLSAKPEARGGRRR
jgi:ATP-dependent helicase HrpB